MVKVLHVLGHIPVGGVGSFLINTTKHINKMQFTFDFVMFNSDKKSNFCETIVSLGGKATVFQTFLGARNILRMYKEIDSYLSKEKQYDIIHLHATNLGFLVFPLAIKYGTKVRILHSHSVKFSDSAIKSVRNWFANIPNYLLATHYMACSQEAGRFLYGKKDFFLAKNGIEINDFKLDLEKRNNLRKLYKVDDKVVIGNIGNFLPVKNHCFLIEIFNELVKLNKNCVLMLIGEGVLKQEIEESIKSFNLQDSVKFLGRSDIVSTMIQMLDIAVLPSKNEGFGMVAIETQISGLRTIVSNAFSKDVNVTDCIEYIELEKSAHEWANIIYSGIEYIRNDQSDQVKKMGYEIKDTVGDLEKYYFSILRSR